MSYPKRAADSDGAYSFEVENFGPIARASVALRPLTIFVGHGDTGKSFLALLLYALHRSVLSGVGHRRDEFPWYPRPLTAPAGRSESDEEALTAWLSAGSLTPLPEAVETTIRAVCEPRVRSAVSDEIRRCFGVVHLSALVRESDPSARSRIVVRARRRAQESVLRFDFGRRGPDGDPAATLSHLAGGASVSKNAARWGARLVGGRRPDEFSFVLQAISDAVFEASFEPALRNADYLPADRTGVLHSHLIIVTTLIQRAASVGLRPGSGEAPRLSGSLADFLERLLDIGKRRPPPAAEDFGAGIERLLRGSVRVTANELSYPEFTFRPDGWSGDDLPLARASSTVSELAPVVLYLRYFSQRGGVLILEEPEAHLHPTDQTALARELVRVVRNGVRLVLVTHSEWLLEQIGNLVQLSTLPEERRKGIGSAPFALPADEVGVWLFREGAKPRGSVVEEVRLEPETGLFPAGFDSVSEALYNESAVIFNRLAGAAV